MNKNQTLSVCLIIISAVLCYQPWIIYQGTDLVLRGTNGDGIVFLTLLLISLLLLVFDMVKRQLSKRSSLVDIFVGGFICVASINKIMFFNNSISEYNPEKYFQILMVSSARVTDCLYFLVITTAILSISGGVRLFYNKTDNIKINFLLPFSLLLVLMFSYYLYANPLYSNDSTIQSSIVKSSKVMFEAYDTENYDEFIKYTHPVLVNMYGGRDNFLSSIDDIRNNIISKNMKMSDFNVALKSDIHKDGRIVQCLIEHSISYSNIDTNENVYTEKQNIVALSKNAGDTWYFINIDNQSKEELKKFFPEIDKTLIKQNNQKG